MRALGVVEKIGEGFEFIKGASGESSQPSADDSHAIPLIEYRRIMYLSPGPFHS